MLARPSPRIRETTPPPSPRGPACVAEIADPAGLAAMRRLRYDVLVRELGCYANIADHTLGELGDAGDDNAQHWGWYEKGRLAGAVRQRRRTAKSGVALPELPFLWAFDEFPVRALAISDYRVMLTASRGGRGHLALLQASYQAARAAGVLFDFVHVRPRHIRDWELLGYRRYADAYDRAGAGCQVPMVLMLDDRRYLERVRSPLLPVARLWSAQEDRSAWFEARFPDSPTTHSAAIAPRAYRQTLAQTLDRLRVPALDNMDGCMRSLLLASATRLRLPAGLALDAPNKRANSLCLVLEGELRGQDGSYRRGPGEWAATRAYGTLQALPEALFAGAATELLLFDNRDLERLSGVYPELDGRLHLAIERGLAR